MNLKIINLHPSRQPPPCKWRQIIFGFCKTLSVQSCLTTVRSPQSGICNQAGRNLQSLICNLNELTVIWTDDPKMAELNWQFLHHKGPTDILTFDYGNGSAELVISLDTALHQASLYHKTLAQELTLYLAHGILHLNGMNDQTPSQRRQMRKAELNLLRNAD